MLTVLYKTLVILVAKLGCRSWNLRVVQSRDLQWITKDGRKNRGAQSDRRNRWVHIGTGQLLLFLFIMRHGIKQSYEYALIVGWVSSKRLSMFIRLMPLFVAEVMFLCLHVPLYLRYKAVDCGRFVTVAVLLWLC